MSRRRTIFMDLGLTEFLNQTLCSYLLEVVKMTIDQGDPEQHYVFVFDVWSIPKDVAARRMIYTTMGEVISIGKLWMPLRPNELPGANEAFWFSAREVEPSRNRFAPAKYPRIQAMARKASISADGGLETLADDALKDSLVSSLAACAKDHKELKVYLEDLDKPDFAKWSDIKEVG